MQLTCLSWDFQSPDINNMVRVHESGSIVAELSDELRQQPSAQETAQERQSDESLMLAYQSGDAAAFDQLYERFRQSLYRFMSRQLQGDADSLNELYQDVWLKLIKSRDSYTETASFKTYLYQIANNTIRDFFRRAAVRKVVTAEANMEYIDPHACPVEQLEIGQLHHRLISAIRLLPQEQREVFLLKEEAGLSIQQIATVVSSSNDTVKSRLRYAVAKLRSAITEQAQIQSSGDEL